MNKNIQYRLKMERLEALIKLNNKIVRERSRTCKHHILKRRCILCPAYIDTQKQLEKFISDFYCIELKF